MSWHCAVVTTMSCTCLLAFSISLLCVFVCSVHMCTQTSIDGRMRMKVNQMGKTPMMMQASTL